MDLGIKDKKAVITGGATGIGRAISIELAKEGVNVFIISRSKANALKTIDMIGGEKAGHMYFVTDINDDKVLSTLYSTITYSFGNPDIIINNAGSTLSVTDPYCTNEDWRKVLKLNLEIPVIINNLFLPHMKEVGWGRIVNITAGAALENSGPVPYCASKAALTAYTRSMGRILAIESDDVVMSAVLPGVIITEEGHWGGKYKEDSEHAKKYLNDRCPLGRFGKPEEISSMVAYLCSKKASFAHGGIYLVDAGQAKHYMYNSFL